MRLARETIEILCAHRQKICVPDGLPQEMYDRRAGVFVSLKKDGRLRGCIGTISAVQGQHCRRDHRKCRQSSAATRDPRFHAVEREELDSLVYSVDVLGDTEKISSPDELDCETVRCGREPRIPERAAPSESGRGGHGGRTDRDCQTESRHPRGCG